MTEATFTKTLEGLQDLMDQNERNIASLGNRGSIAVDELLILTLNLAEHTKALSNALKEFIEGFER